MDGEQFRLRVTPRGGRETVEGWVRDAECGMLLKARVAAAPEVGKASVALTTLLAKMLGVPKKAVAIRSGATARIKRSEICGNPAAFSARLAKLGETR